MHAGQENNRRKGRWKEVESAILVRDEREMDWIHLIQNRMLEREG